MTTSSVANRKTDNIYFDKNNDPRFAIVAVYPSSNGDLQSVVELVRHSILSHNGDMERRDVNTAFYKLCGATPTYDDCARRKLAGIYHLYEDTMRDLNYRSINDENSYRRQPPYVRVTGAGVELLHMLSLCSPDFVDTCRYANTDFADISDQEMFISNVLVTAANYENVLICIVKGVLSYGKYLMQRGRDTLEMIILLHSYDYSAPVTLATHQCARRLHRILARLLCTTYVYLLDESFKHFCVSNSIGDRTTEVSIDYIYDIPLEEYAETFREVDSDDTHLSYMIKCTLRLSDWTTPRTLYASDRIIPSTLRVSDWTAPSTLA